MKLLHLAKYYHPYRGGIETVVKNLCVGACSFAEVSVLCFNDANTQSVDSLDGVSIDRIPRLGVVASQPLSFHMLKKIPDRSNVDLIHLHSPNPLFELSCLLFIDKKIPIVVTHHSDIVRQKVLGALYKPFLKMFYERVEKIIVPTKNHISSSNILTQFQDKVEIAPFGINPKEYPNDKKVDDIASQSISKYGNYFIFIGRLVGYKGLEYLVKSMENISGNLIICGEGPEKENLIALAKEKNISKKNPLFRKGKRTNFFRWVNKGIESIGVTFYFLK